MNKNIGILITIVLLPYLLFAQNPTADSVYRMANKYRKKGEFAKSEEILIAAAAKTDIYMPIPPTVIPGATSQDAPSDAIILFNGNNLDAWMTVDSTKCIGWKIIDGAMEVDNKSGSIRTKQKFMDYQLHIEWLIPKDVIGEGQNCGNSGVSLAYTVSEDGYNDYDYEIQILESYKNKTYVNGMAGALYKQSIPLANASKKPGEWQTYDIIWKAPRFNDDGTLKRPAFVTVIHNGVAIQNNTEVKGHTAWIGEPVYTKHGAAPIKLQAHGDHKGPEISFRNIWLRPQ